jgi:N-formylglutamate deformylase
MEIVTVVQAAGPLLVSFPHSGTEVPDSIRQRFTLEGKRLADTDWYVPQLYKFLARLPVSTVTANYSRYVIDVNRSSEGAALYPGQRETELCPTSTFADQPVYRHGELPNEDEIALRRERYWQPYHQALSAELERIKTIHGYALLWDAHSIAAEVPRFFDGRLPSLNLGTADNRSCHPRLAQDLYSVIHKSGFTSVHNGRFKGGYITRHYGDPQASVQAVQMEIAQSAYLSDQMTDQKVPELDSKKAERLSDVLMKIIVIMTCYRSE